MKKKYIIIFFILLTGYLVSMVLIKNIFIAASPQIRPDLAMRFSDILNKNSFLAQLFQIGQQTPEEKLKDIPLQMISKGVYAKSKDNYSYTVIRADEVEWIEYMFNINGKQIKIKVPKGQTPPSQESVELMSR